MSRSSRLSGATHGTALGAAVSAVALVALLAAAGTAAAGPPFPDPVAGQRVYDEALVLSDATEAAAEQIVEAIEARSGAQIVVYTQVVGYVSEEDADAHARALIDEWGIGRAGYDDGFVLLLDLETSRCDGVARLYAAGGFHAAYLGDEARQRIYDEAMAPRLRDCDLDGAVLAALGRIDDAITPDATAFLERSRIANAILGLVVAPALFLLLAGWALLRWWRFGRDPRLADSESILIPAPPPDLTPATGALVHAGRTTQRAFTAALFDLGSRGELTFVAVPETKTPVPYAIDLSVARADDIREAFERSKATRSPLGPAEEGLLASLRTVAAGGRLEPERLTELTPLNDWFGAELERAAVAAGWFPERPRDVLVRSGLIAGIELALGIGGVFLGNEIPMSGLVVAGAALAGAGVVTGLLAPAMPRTTREGARLRIMLNAYRRTLERTMAQARSMDQVVREAGLDWLDSPDVAVVWSVALGLGSSVERILERTAADLGSGDSTDRYVPRWLVGGDGGRGAGGTGSVFSGGALPDFSGMVATLGSIGQTASGGGSGGSGGFGGGSSSGGGGSGGRF